MAKRLANVEHIEVTGVVESQSPASLGPFNVK
jgi:hypothetical protein